LSEAQDADARGKRRRDNTVKPYHDASTARAAVPRARRRVG
jgi:hypothetical protein